MSPEPAAGGGCVGRSSRPRAQAVQERVEPRERAGVAVRLLERLPGVPRLLLAELWIVAQETDGSREARGVALPQRGATPVRGDRVVDVRPLRPGVDHG